MQTRRDHVQAYQFVASRLASALTTGDPGRGEPPLRRSSLGLMWGVLVAVLLCGGFAVYGLINPGGNDAYKKPGAIVVEKETGNRYLYINGTLYPTLNSASAMLFFAGTNTTGAFTSVSRNSLVGVPHGRAVGIPGAPDSVPRAQDMLPAQWSLCAAPGADEPSMRVDLDPATPSTLMPADAKFLVQGQDHVNYVVWRNTIYPIGSHNALVALALGDTPPALVPTAWIHQLHLGQTLDVPAIEDAGQPGPVVDGQPTRVGDLLDSVVGGDKQTYVLRKDGIAPVNDTALALLEAKSGAHAPREISTSALAELPQSADSSTLQGMPNVVTAKTYTSDDAAVCVRQKSSGDTVSAGFLVTEPLSVSAGRITMNVPAGRGLIAVSEPAPQQADQRVYYLITDLGEKFRVAQQAFGALGVGGTAVGMPKEVLDALPSGPNLVTGQAVLTANTQGGQ
ncbi:type VII secretion protein EccB [Kutzneria sp. NPDC052558]|uniref:type VII secretion protein EccB n=1 Tax=Kutzneria sp. NPDC052558 TaxID=3364121 RepID=UPI0037C7F1F3